MSANELQLNIPEVNVSRRSFLKWGTALAGTVAALNGLEPTPKDAEGFAYTPHVTDDEMTTVVTSCAHDCGSRHALVCHVKDGIIRRISTDDGSYVDTLGYDTPQVPQLRACLRGRSYRQRIYHPGRLLYPLQRVGARGEGKFKRISWEEAYRIILDRIGEIKAKYGPTAILDLGYAGTSFCVLHKSDQTAGLLSHFLQHFGCRTSFWNVPSFEGTSFAARMTFGTMSDGNEADDFLHSKLIIFWGWNPAFTFFGDNTHWMLKLAKKKGTQFVAVDPVHTDSSSAFGAWWIPIRPSTDAAMMLAMAYVMFAENLVDWDFIRRFTVGVTEDTLPPGVPQGNSFLSYLQGKQQDGTPKTPQWAAEITGVPAEHIVRLARMYATMKPAALVHTWAAGRSAYGEQYTRAAYALCAITGNIGIHGGNAGGMQIAFPVHGEVMENPGLAHSLVKLDRFADAVLKYPHVSPADIGVPSNMGKPVPNIRAAWVHAFNAFQQIPNVNKTMEALKKLDFIVVQEQTENFTTKWADIVLPICTLFERYDIALKWMKGRYYIARPKVIERLGESRSDLHVFTELAYRLGFGEKFNPKAGPVYDDQTELVWLREFWEGKVIPQMRQWNQTEMTFDDFMFKKGMYKFRLPEPYIAFKEQIQYGQPFQTPTGKIEIYSTQIARNFFVGWENTQYGAPIPPIPAWIDPWEGPFDSKRAQYPLQAITPHPRWRTHSIFYNIPWLRETYEQEVLMNTVDAEARGIKSGDVVKVYNDRGTTVLLARATERIMPGVVCIYEGAWPTLDEHGIDHSGSADILTADRPSPAGSFAFNTLLVEVEKTNLPYNPGFAIDVEARSFRHRYMNPYRKAGKRVKS